MMEISPIHNRFRDGISAFIQQDPHLLQLSKLKYQHSSNWWSKLSLTTPGIYILTGGRQIGKSTSCKLLIKHCLEKLLFSKRNILYLPCDEIFDAQSLSVILRDFLQQTDNKLFLLIVDEITYVSHWERVIKSLADEGWFNQGLCLLTGSDTLILKEAAMSFPGRRGTADQTDFHLYPLNFFDYVTLISGTKKNPGTEKLHSYFQDYLQCGGYLRAINDFAKEGKISPATFQTYEQWIRGDFLKQGKNESYLLAVLSALYTVGVTQISYSSLTQKTGLLSKETLIDYCRLLLRMDILFELNAFDQNKKIGFPKKDRKFHFFDPFIYQTLFCWLKKEGLIHSEASEHVLVESCVASHCIRLAKTFYFKGQGEVDAIWLKDNIPYAIEVKWSNQLRPNDIKTLKQFHNSIILTKLTTKGTIEGISSMPVYEFLYAETK